MVEQLTFDLPVRSAQGRDDFFVSPANALAVAMLDVWPNWPNGKLVLTGSKGAGKSHLAQVWATQVDAQIVSATALTWDMVAQLAQCPAVVEDADEALSDEAEQALFHLHNLLESKGLLVTGQTAATRWPIRLPDLASRLQAMTTVALEPPDDALLTALLVKLFDDRQLMVPPAVIRYAVPRMERSFVAAQHLVATLDAQALRMRSAVTLGMARAILDTGGEDA